MDEAARVRAAACEALADVAPAQLKELLDAHLDDAAMTPGVLVYLSARAVAPDVDPDQLDRRAAGVQLIYEGLAVTRRLARTNPWADDERADAADVDILAADVLVARGFFLLARTEAAPKAVETVRAFGRDEADLAAGRIDADAADCALEANVFELAIAAGVSAAGIEPPTGHRAFALELARSFDRRLPAVPELVSEPTVEALADLVADRGPPTASAERVWAGSSMSDP